MNLKINGDIKTVPDSIETVNQLLDFLEIKPQRVAVEANGDIVVPTLFSETSIKENDSIEIVSFVGGG